MTFSFRLLPPALRAVLLRRPRPAVLYAATWTALLTATVAVTSFSPEVAFVWAVAPSSSFSRACGGGLVRVPLEGPQGDLVCLPDRLVGRSRIDPFVPPVFAALVVAGSACFVRAIGWEETPVTAGDDRDF